MVYLNSSGKNLEKVKQWKKKITITLNMQRVQNFLSYTERKKKRRVNFIPNFHSRLKKFVKYFTMITKRYM